MSAIALDDTNSHLCELCRSRLFPKTKDVLAKHMERHAADPEMACVHGYEQRMACPDCGDRGFVPKSGEHAWSRPRKTGKGPPRKKHRLKDIVSIRQNYGPTKHGGTRIR